MPPRRGPTDEALRWALEHPDQALRDLDRLDAEGSLLGFIRYMWPVLEPGRPFTEGWCVEAVCEHLEAVSRGEIKKLLINIPPGAMKSLATSVFWPAFEWGPQNRADLRYLTASYAEVLTVRDNRRMRQLVTSSRYQDQWGDRFQLTGDQNAKVRFDTTRTGWRIATSVGGAVTGQRADRLIVDDPHNVQEGESEATREAALRWFAETWTTRGSDEDATSIVIMQRVHARDVAGMILEEDLGYEHLMLPMEFERSRRCVTSIGWQDPRQEEGELLWPERFSADYLEGTLKKALRSWGGTYAEASQLQQRPMPRGGGIFKRADFRIVDYGPEPGQGWRVRGWDFAGSKDGHAAWTVGVRLCMHEGTVYVEDVRRIQGSPTEVEQLLLATAEMDGYACEVDFPQDPGQAGKAQKVNFAKLLHGFVARSSPETGSKEDRARPFAAQVGMGNVALVRGPWNEAFLKEFEAFPVGAYKDQVDATSRAYSRFVVRQVEPVGLGPRVVRLRGR